MKVDLLKHNQVAYGKIKSLIAEGKKKIAISHATGTGKSYLVAKLFEDYSNDKKLVLAPSRYIKEQMQKLFEKYDIENVDIILYQKLIKMSDEDIAGMDYQVIALDEYHHDAATKVWGEKVGLLINSHQESIIFGTSATPVRTDGVNAIDALFEGNCASDLPLPESIAKKIVPLPKYVGALYTLDDELERLRKKVENATNSKEEKKEFYKKINAMRSQIEKSYGMPIILNKHIKDKEGKYIVFCKNKKHLDEIKDTVIGWFHTAGFKDIHSYVVHSSYEGKDKEYKAFCDDTSHTLKLLFSVDMLNEGLHLENISGVLLLRPTRSSIVWHQQIGRAIEANNTNTPVIIDAVNNFSSIGQGMELLREIKDAVAREKEGNPEFDDSGFEDIDTFFVLEQVVEIQEMFKEIEGRLQSDWENGLKHFDKYVREHNGDVLVPQNYVDEDGFCTGSWVGHRRRNFKNKKLPMDKIDELNKRGFVWDVLQYNFEINIKALTQYKEREGDCLVPGNHIEVVCGEEIHLGHWCQNLRASNRFLAYEDREQLEQLDFIWDTVKYKFEKKVRKVAAYHKKYGEFPSQHSENFEIRKLGIFLVNIRQSIKNNHFAEWKMELIKKYIPEFSIEHNSIISFNRFLFYAKLYKEENGHLDIKINDVMSDNYKIGIVFCGLKQQYKKGLIAVNEGIVINIKNQMYNEVNLYTWIRYTINKKYKNNDLSNEEKTIIEKLTGKSLENSFNNGIFVRIVDMTNKEEIAICRSKAETAGLIQKNYSIKVSEGAIQNRLTGKVTTPYKDKFMFYYATDEEIKQYFSDNKAV